MSQAATRKIFRIKMFLQLFVGEKSFLLLSRGNAAKFEWKIKLNEWKDARTENEINN